jgi:hypothetical protein
MGWTPQYLDGLYPSIPGWAVPLNTWMGWTLLEEGQQGLIASREVNSLCSASLLSVQLR